MYAANFALLSSPHSFRDRNAKSYVIKQTLSVPVALGSIPAGARRARDVPLEIPSAPAILVSQLSSRPRLTFARDNRRADVTVRASFACAFQVVFRASWAMVVVSSGWVRNVAAANYQQPPQDDGDDMVIPTTEMCAKAVLICRPNSHPFQERSLCLDQPVKVGRSVARARAAPNNAIFDCKVLSRHHALLWYENGKFFLQVGRGGVGLEIFRLFCLAFVCGNADK